MRDSYIFATAPLPALTPAEFAEFGKDFIVFVKKVKTTEVQRLLPQATGLPADTDLFLVVGADGTPLVVTDTRNAAVGHIVQDELQEVAVH